MKRISDLNFFDAVLTPIFYFWMGISPFLRCEKSGFYLWHYLTPLRDQRKLKFTKSSFENEVVFLKKFEKGE